MEKKNPLDELWEKQILNQRSKAEIRATEREGCIRSRIEWAHIERDKCKQGKKAKKSKK